jgi:hypothetical protein
MNLLVMDWMIVCEGYEWVGMLIDAGKMKIGL